MKTKEELLKFYNVEFDKTYKITGTSNQVYLDLVDKKFEITDTATFDEFGIKIKPFDKFFKYTLLNLLKYEESTEILNNQEKEYLQKNIVDHPIFKGRIKYIEKIQYATRAFLEIETINGPFDLPSFQSDTMYQDMKPNKSYTLKELGLKE